jgi:CRISPR-associated protein Cmr6
MTMAIARLEGADGRRRALVNISRGGDTHAGLWLDKHLSVLNPRDDDQKQAIRRLIKEAGKIETPDGYEQALRQRERMLRLCDGGVEGGTTLLWTGVVQGRMVVGLGAESVRETNIALEHTWGVPVIPGSALKGVAAAAAHRFGGESWAKTTTDGRGGADHRTLFGDTSSQGFVTFHDAWWIPKSGEALPFELDIMTVHHADYYGGQEAAPADWDEPNPVAFLTAQGSYLIALSGPDGWVARAYEWLEIALERLGVGGKTRAGYGRLKLERLLTEAEEAIESAYQRITGLPSQHQGAPTARQHLAALVEALEAGVDEASIREVAAALWQRDSSFWKKWRRDNGAERDAMKRVGLVAPPPPPPPPPPPVEEGGESTKQTRRASCGAWLEMKKKKGTIIVMLDGGTRLKRKEKDVEMSDELRAKLEGASEKAPVAATCTLEVTATKEKLIALEEGGEG